MRRFLKSEWTIVLGLTILALAVRLYRLPELPPGLHYDEAANGVDALDVLSGHFSIFFERNYGREPLFIYLQAIAVALLGATPFALRVTSAIIGALTVPAIYWMVKEALTRIRTDARWLALWTALFVTFSYWHLNFSRIGYRAILLPLLASIAFAWFWRAWWKIENGESLPWRDLILCGVFTGSCLYTYIAGRFMPILIVGVALAGALLTRRSRARLKQIALAVGVIGISALVVFAPLGLYFLAHPESFLGRATDVSVFSPKYNQGNVLGTLATSVIETAKMFAIAGDPNWRHNPAGRPVFDPVLAVWLTVGLVLAVRRWRVLPYFFALAWFFIFALPAVLTASELPHSLRALGLIPVAYFLIVLALVTIGNRLLKQWKFLGEWVLLFLVLLLHGTVSLQDYFTAWQSNSKLSTSFQVYFTELAREMNMRGQADAVWVLPLSPAFLIFMPTPANYPVTFLYHGDASYGLVVSDETAPHQLQFLTTGRNKAYLIRWKDETSQPEGIYFYADPKHLISFLLNKHGRLIGEETSGGTLFTTFELPESSDYRVATTFVPVEIPFGDKVRLTGAAYGHTATQRNEPADALEEKWVPSGHTAWVVLRWQAQAPLDFDLKTTLYLTDEAGHLAGQVDDLLVGDRYPFYRVWERNEVASTYHILPIFPAVPPGRYNLYLGVYEEKTLQRYPVLDTDGQPISAALLLGSVQVTRPLDSPTVSPTNPLSDNPILAPGIALLGYDLPGNVFSPGDKLPLTLYWQARAASLADYTVYVELHDSTDRVVAHQSARPRYATTEWQSGDVWRDWHDLEIPITIPSGDYQLMISLHEGTTRVNQMTLGNVQVQGRPHQFTLPSIEHPMKYQVGSSISFLGYDLNTRTARPGETVRLTLYWQALDRIDRSYTVFAHLLGSDGQLYGQQDNLPSRGTAPTTSWIPGEYIADEYNIQIKPEAPPGEYRIEIGMYDAVTGMRLVTSMNGHSPGDHILLDMPVQVSR